MFFCIPAEASEVAGGVNSSDNRTFFTKGIKFAKIYLLAVFCQLLLLKNMGRLYCIYVISLFLHLSKVTYGRSLQIISNFTSN